MLCRAPSVDKADNEAEDKELAQVMMLNTIQNAVMFPVHRAGWPFIALFAAVTIVLFFIAEPLGWLGVILTVWCALFFRDPDRMTPLGDNLVISPADGVVQLIDRATPPPELEMGDDERTRIAVFMNVFNVHVNRTPVSGTVTKLAHRPGAFLDASLDKASTENERQSIRIKIAGVKSRSGKKAAAPVDGKKARQVADRKVFTVKKLADYDFEKHGKLAKQAQGILLALDELGGLANTQELINKMPEHIKEVTQTYKKIFQHYVTLNPKGRNKKKLVRLNLIEVTEEAKTLTKDNEIAVVQIAGLVARRILCDLTEGDALTAGDRIGLIRFGSRVDVYLPDGCEPLVAVGQMAIAGETVIAEIGAEAPRQAQRR